MSTLRFVLIILVCLSAYGQDALEVIKSNEWISDKIGTMAWISKHRPNLVKDSKISNYLVR